MILFSSLFSQTRRTSSSYFIRRRHINHGVARQLFHAVDPVYDLLIRTFFIRTKNTILRSQIRTFRPTRRRSFALAVLAFDLSAIYISFV